MYYFNVKPVAAISILALALSACGGGSGGNVRSDAPPPSPGNNPPQGNAASPGEGKFVKSGSNITTLSAKNIYLDKDVLVDEGILRVSGTLHSDVEVAPGATFATGGTGARINGDYEAYGEREWSSEYPRHPRGGMATTAIQIGAPLHVAEDAEIGGSRLLLLPPENGYTVKTIETLITTGKGINGRFAKVDTAQGFFWNVQLNYTGLNLIANLIRTSAQAQALSLGAPQQVVAGAGMADTLIGYTDGLVTSGQTAGHEALIDASAKLMSAASNDTAALSLSSLTGDIHGAARHLGIQRALGDGERLSNRLRSLGTHAEHGVWVQNDSGHGHLNRLGYGDAEVRHSVFGIGMDERFGHHWTLGFSATRTRSNAHLDTFGGRLAGSGSQMAVYALTDLGRRGYLGGLAIHDRHIVDTQRRVLAGNTLSSVVGQHTDSTTLVRLESGVRLGFGLTPYLATGSLSLRQGGFTESGILGLSAAADTFSATFADLGARFDRRFGRWTLASTLSARRLFGGDTGFNAAFTGAEAAGFTINGQPVARTRVRFDNELNYRTRRGWQYALGLGVEQGGGQRGNAWGEASVEVGF